METTSQQLNNAQTIKNIRNLCSIPADISDEAISRVISHYDTETKSFVFPLTEKEISSVHSRTVYHVIPRYSPESAEDVISKLRRLMNYELAG
ncbi:MAG: hypothetical protein FWH42_05200 [Dehalococcoidia bacterium]|nr:hypothetical protein [Dehalococcoidia bacterium]